MKPINMSVQTRIGITCAVSVCAVVMIFQYARLPHGSGNVFQTQEAPDAVTVESRTEATRRDVRILFGGDMMFDRWIREKTAKRGNAFVFDGVRDEIQLHDMTVANLEGPITDQVSKSVGSTFGSHDNYLFTFDPSWAETLADEKIGPVDLGNNHILNQGDSGLVATKRFLDDADVTSFGDPLSKERIALRTVNGIRISFVSYDEFIREGQEQTFMDIKAARESSDIVIAYAHWGSEYQPVRDDVRRLAHAFVDAGCDAVIGSHPHVVQEKEIYAGKKIYYSLGNFVFDQYFREDTRKGLLVSMTIDTTTRNLTFRDIPIALHADGSTSVMDVSDNRPELEIR